MKFATPSFTQTLMLPRIPDGSWRLDASDPQALTRLLDLPGRVVTGVEYNDVQESWHLLCQLSTKSALCPICQPPRDYIPPYPRRSGRDLPWAGKPCLLEFLARRFFCPGCLCPFREELDGRPRCRRLTPRYRQAGLAAWRQTNRRAVSQPARLGYKTVERLYYALAPEQIPWLPQTPVRPLGIDAFALKKGHDQFAVALCALEAGRVLAVLADRKKETVRAYFATGAHAPRVAGEQVALDLWETYAPVSAACFPKARPVADRFHGFKNLTDQVTKARRDLQRALPEATRHTLKGGRWLLVKNAADRAEADKATLEALFAHAPALERLHGLKEDFRTLFQTATEPTEAAVALDAWITSVETSGLSALLSFVALLRKRWEPIRNYFHTRLSSGGVEGWNNKIKVVKRSA